MERVKLFCDGRNGQRKFYYCLNKSQFVKPNPLLIFVLAIVGTVFTTPHANAQQILHGHVPEAIARLHLQPKGRLAATNELWLALGLPLRDRAGLENFVAQGIRPGQPKLSPFPDAGGIDRALWPDRAGL
jgi:hypothetical protein